MRPAYLRIAVFPLSLVALHLVVVSGQSRFVFIVLAAAALAHLALALVAGAGRAAVWTLASLTMLLAALQGAVLASDATLARLAAIPPVIANGWVACCFLRTLAPNREPLITRFSRLHRPIVPTELQRYTRTLTKLWAAYMVGLTLLAAGVGAFADLTAWSWIVNIFAPALTVLLFLAEHAYRSVVFHALGRNSPLDTLRMLVRHDTWTAS